MRKTHTASLLCAVVLTAVAIPAGCSRAPGEGELAGGGEPLARPTTVNALGRLEPRSRIVHVGAQAGSRLQRLEVAPGDDVEAGAPIAYLDSHEEAQASLRFAEAQLTEAQELQQVEKAAGDAEVEQARLDLRHAEEVLSLQIAAHREAVDQAEIARDEAHRDLARAEKLYADKTLSKSEYEDIRTTSSASERLYNERLNTLSQMERDRELQIESAGVHLRQAETASSRQQLLARVASLGAAVALARAQVERTIVRAPIAGRVLQVLTRAGETITGPIIKLADPTEMQCVAEVYETDVIRVRVGQLARIVSRAFPDVLQGTVIEIGSLVQPNEVLSVDPTADIDARIVEVRISLEAAEPASSYMQHQVDVSILLDSP